jgi:hypothetical protein
MADAQLHFSGQSLAVHGHKLLWICFHGYKAESLVLSICEPPLYGTLSKRCKF